VSAYIGQAERQRERVLPQVLHLGRRFDKVGLRQRRAARAQQRRGRQVLLGLALAVLLLQWIARRD
jgi:hypothetical protein